MCDVVRVAKPLQKLDRNAVFRFEDLAAELRIKVYRFLLVKEDGDRTKRLWTGIMATSKKINGETEDVLYTDTTLRITHRVAIPPLPYWHDRQYQIESKLGQHSWALDEALGLKEMFAAYRAWMPLTKFKRISLRFFDHASRPLRDLKRVTEHLYAMTSFLAVSSMTSPSFEHPSKVGFTASSTMDPVYPRINKDSC